MWTSLSWLIKAEITPRSPHRRGRQTKRTKARQVRRLGSWSILADDVGRAAKCGSDDADALPEQPHPVLLLRANVLGFRARGCAPVKPSRISFSRSQNCDISPDGAHATHLEPATKMGFCGKCLVGGVPTNARLEMSGSETPKNVADGLGVPLPHAFRVLLSEGAMRCGGRAHRKPKGHGGTARSPKCHAQLA
jgi:hypothetical protein